MRLTTTRATRRAFAFLWLLIAPVMGADRVAAQKGQRVEQVKGLLADLNKTGFGKQTVWLGFNGPVPHIRLLAQWLLKPSANSLLLKSAEIGSPFSSIE